MKNSKYFTTPNTLLKYQGFCPGAQPITKASFYGDTQTFKDYHISVELCEHRDGQRPDLQMLRRLGDIENNEKLIDSLIIMPTKAVDWNKDDILYLKDEPIYLKKDIVELHTVERWYKEQRQVKKEQIGSAVRKVKGLYNNPEREALLYGYW